MPGVTPHSCAPTASYVTDTTRAQLGRSPYQSTPGRTWPQFPGVVCRSEWSGGGSGHLEPIHLLGMTQTNPSTSHTILRD